MVKYYTNTEIHWQTWQTTFDFANYDTIKNDEILKYTGKLHLPLQTMLVNLRKSPELSDSIE